MTIISKFVHERTKSLISLSYPCTLLTHISARHINLNRITCTIHVCNPVRVQESTCAASIIQFRRFGDTFSLHVNKINHELQVQVETSSILSHAIYTSSLYTLYTSSSFSYTLIFIYTLTFIFLQILIILLIHIIVISLHTHPHLNHSSTHLSSS